MKNGTRKCLAALALLCLMVMCAAVPLASAYSNAYGVTQDRLRVRETASTNSTVIDNLVKGGVVYITSSNNYGSSEYAKIKYRNADGDISTGYACISDTKNTYIKVLSQAQTTKAYGESIKGGTLPSAKVGTFTAAERKASEKTSDSTYIKLNTRSDAVKTLQTKLKALGYYNGDLTGKAGEKTIAAIKDFQSKNGLTADGVAGPSTLAKVDAAYSKQGGSSSASSSTSGLKLNSNGTDVRDLQTDLTYLGYYWATISGNFGEKTETAVKRFQEENGLTADGVAGTKTLNAIAEAVKKKGGSSASSSNTGSTLKLNSQGNKVSQLQIDLKSLGYYYATITGNFGPKTETAVKEFQKAKGLTADGVAGPRTLDAIDAAIVAAGGSANGSSSASGLKVGSTGAEVRALQEDLTTLNFYYGDITGHFGSMTQTAVKKFQKSRGLTQDGVAGKKTLDALASAVEGTGNTSASSSSSSSNTLRRGDTNNPKIGDLQTRLKALELYYGDITNDFGPKTETAVKKFQDKYGLTVDGVAGTATLNKLYSLTGGSSSSGTTSNTSGSGTTVSAEKSYGKIIKNNVYLRSKASTTSASKASLTNGTLVRINKEYTTNDGMLWYYISVKSGDYTYKGYVRSDMMQRITEAEYNNAGGNSSNNDSDQEVMGMIRVTGNGVRLRYSPSTDAQKVGEANKGEVFYYVSHNNGWYQTSAGYWLSDQFATVMSSEEVKEYLGTSSGTTITGTYRYGSTGSMVESIKNMLLTLGYNAGGKLTAGPFFGYNTEAAVKDFQRANKLDPDGIVGKKTLELLTSAYNGSIAGGTTVIGDAVYNLDWFKYKSYLNNLGLVRGNETCTVTDLLTNKTFSIYVQSTGNHADVEPLTAADTAVMCSIYGVSSEVEINWVRRPVLVTIGKSKFQIVGSMYGDSHGQDDKGNNNYVGQFCIHFLNSTNHSTGNGSVPAGQNHQDKIKEAVEIITKQGKNVLTEPLSTSQIE